MRAEVISIGSELLEGELTDTNAPFLARQLLLLGIELNCVSVVGDDLPRLVKTLRQSCHNADLVLTTGGLGPTQDDITREAVAELLGEQLVLDQVLISGLKTFFSSFSTEMPECNLKQAMIIPSARVLPNPKGTAPGWWVEWKGHNIVSMPGPPREMQCMWEREVLPQLEGRSGEVIVSRTLKTFGLSEGKVDEIVSSLCFNGKPTYGTYAKSDGVQLRITTRSGNVAEAQELVQRTEGSIRAVLGDYIWGVDSDSLESVVGNMLGERGITLATMESSTGGTLCNLLSCAAGSETYYKGGLVVSETSKRSFGLISPDNKVREDKTVGEMASIARRHFCADLGLAVEFAANVRNSGNVVNSCRVLVSIDFNQQRASSTRDYPSSVLQIGQRAANMALWEVKKFLTERYISGGNS